MRKKSIIVQDVTKTYRIFNTERDRFVESITNGKVQRGKDHHALLNVSFEVEEGEILGIIGVNGSGKSTLLKIITGILTPTSGNVTVNGKISALLELGAGFNPEYTGIENIRFNGMLMGFTEEEMNAKMQGIIDFADIGDFINQPVRTYSSGMYVRLAYAVAVSIEPDILIVDEALAVGDAYFQMKSMSKMQDLFQKGKTVLFVSHDTASVKSLCTKAIWLDKGRIVVSGLAEDVVDAYEAKVRDEMSGTQKYVDKNEQVMQISENYLRKASKKQRFLVDSEYAKHVAPTREGSGEARVTAVEFLDKEGKEITITEFGTTAFLRLHIQFEKACDITVGYHIRDSRNIPILGSNTLMENMGQLHGEAGDKVIVEFECSLPLRDGRYNIMTVLSSVIIMNRSASFVDLTKDGLYFDVLERKPVRVWNTIQLPNAIKIWKV